MPRKNAKLAAAAPLTPDRYEQIMDELYPRDLHKELFMHELKASETLYRWWYEFVKAASADAELMDELTASPERAVAVHQTLEKFGDLKDCFQVWWDEGGSSIFQERGVPIVEVINHTPEKENSRQDIGLLVRIPLNINRELILEQINVLLEIYHPKDALRRHEYSTAELKLYPHQRKKKTDYDRLLNLWREVNEAKRKGTLNKYWRAYCNYAGEVSLRDHLDGEGRGDKITIAELERLGIRAYKQADKIIRNSIAGDFPKDG